MIEKGTKVIWRGKKYTVTNSFPLNETDFIYKFKGSNRWVEGKDILLLKKRSKSCILIIKFLHLIKIKRVYDYIQNARKYTII